jgi:hypothetical protein
VRGLEISRTHWHDVVAPAVATRFPSVLPRIAFGLVGEGSECFGFDDDLSRDHDFDPSPCLWLSASDFASHGESLGALVKSLPPPDRAALITAEGSGRRGVHEIGTFYRRFLGLARAPRTIEEWRAMPEAGLFASTNGEIFEDPAGGFSAVRTGLLAFYPEDLRLAKLARCLHTAGQSGQYNLERSVARGELVAVALEIAEFVDAAIAITFLLARRFRPYSKWAHRALGILPLPGPRLHALLADLVASSFGPERGLALVEETSNLLASSLRAQDLSASPSSFLVDHARAVAGRVVDPHLRRMAGAA